ncbi:MAG: DEAD/DEAH box helicase family protein [Oscillospiraceae bacterium]
MTNFDFLTTEKDFDTFSEAAVKAELLYNIDLPSCVLAVRRAAEFAVKWMYSVDSDLKLPFNQNLVSLINTAEFKDIVGADNCKRLDFIRLSGNNAAHNAKKVTPEQAAVALENLFYFLDCVAYLYAEEYTEHTFDPELMNQTNAAAPKPDNPDIDIEKLMAENAALKAELTEKRKAQEQTYTPKPLDMTEYQTRKVYIDVMLTDAGWEEKRDWINEYELDGMPNASEKGYADYVLFGDDGRPLAVVEAKRTCKDVAVGRQQAKLYADIIEKKFGRRPVIFLTNGFDTRIIEPCYPERRISGIYSKRDLEKLFNKMTMRTKLDNVRISDNISGRYYQKEAVKAVCSTFDKENRRKALLVMATGSGKTRTVISLADVLLRHGWVKNVLFLADRNSLVTQAKRAFVNLLPELSVVNLCEDKDNYNARGVFSTYQTMMNCIDTAKDENGDRLYTIGHFDLIICDEAHRSIYKKYKDIFDYFDAHLVGLTATPRDEIDKNTYGIFELQSGIPTYAYELAQAVKDGYLVDFISVETKLKLMTEGIIYDELSESEKEEYEDNFIDENGEMPESIDSSALNEKIFNKDTIRQMLSILTEKGIRIDYGNKLGKTIIFAKNHRHAEKIFEVFNEEYPNLTGFCKVIDNYTNYAQYLIDEFSDPQKMPQIVVSVDMMDTGIDVPEVVNLVFFKKVMSKAKFWQMIGRGTRLCKGLLDGKDKECFYIFDFCGNFEFFRINGKGRDVPTTLSVQEHIFNLKNNIIYKMQDISFQTEELKAYRDTLVNEQLEKILELSRMRDNFAVKLHLKYIDLFSDKKSFDALTPMDLQHLEEEVAPLIQPFDDEISAVRFDALMYAIELGFVAQNKYSRGFGELKAKLKAVSKVSTIPAVAEQKDFISQLLNTDYIERAGLSEFELIREKLRELIKFIPASEDRIYNTDFSDDILSIEEHESSLENDDLQDYKMKVNYYIREHMDNTVIAKLHTNQPLTEEDIHALEKILWSDVGTKDDYEKEYHDKPLGELVREIVGLDMNSAKEAFSRFLNDVNLDERQIYFVNQIVNYIVKNGMMKDFSVLQESPFTDKGDITEVFADLVIWSDIRNVIKLINANAIGVA